MIDHQFRLACSALLSLYFVGLGLYLAGFSSAYWLDTETYNAGLWSECYRDAVYDIWYCGFRDVAAYDGWMIATITFAIAALVFAILGGATYMYVPVSSGFQVASGVSVILTASIWGGYQSQKGLLDSNFIGWSFALAVTGGCFLLVNGLTLAIMVGLEGCTMEEIMPPEPNNSVAPYTPHGRPPPTGFA